MATAVAGVVRDAVERQGACTLLLSGGSTPRAAYELLAERHRHRIPWAQVHLFWGDERFVPASDPRNNARMAREAFLDRVPCPPGNVHPIPTALASADDAAVRYEATLRAHFPGALPAFDLVLLGLGADAHTASIFPGSAALSERDRWVMAVTTPADPPLRVTLTMRALSASAQTFVLVAGADKAAALRRTLDPASPPAQYPAAALQATPGVVWVDRAAAAGSAA